MIDMDHLESLLTARTRLISLTACSNIFGINYDLSAIREMIGERYLCIDASQVIPHHPYDMQAV